MKQDIKQQWVDALTSGDYKQGKWGLKNAEGEFCCLGVLCDLHAKANEQQWVEIGVTKYGEYLGQTTILPEAVMEWADLDSPAPGLISPKNPQHVESLLVLNDGGATFAQIADLIAAQF